MKIPFKLLVALAAIAWVPLGALGDEAPFDGLGLNLGNLYRISPAQSRSISPENRTGEKGQGGMATEGLGKGASRELGRGWKVSPAILVQAKTTVTLAE